MTVDLQSSPAEGRGLPKSRCRAGALRYALAAFALLVWPPLVSATTIEVSDDASLAAALTGVGAGDTIVLTDGSYSGFTVAASGTPGAPILIRAAHPGGATIASGVLQLSQTAYVIVAGLTITTPGDSRTIDGETIKVAVWLEATSHCRVTRSTFRLAGQARDTHWLLLSGNSEGNRIDHNEFGPNIVRGHLVWPRGRRTIDGVTPPADRTPWANGEGPYNPNIARHTRIDHNYFHDHASGMSEAIVLGGLGVTGDYQDTFTTIEHNLFENCDGDAEYVSVKASSNVIRFNTVRTSNGMISLRAGNESSVYGNFLLQGAKPGAGGIKLYEKDHKVFNNYIEGGREYPLLIGGGSDYTSPSFSHAQVFRAQVLHNTVVNPGRQFRVGHGEPLPPTDCVIASNLIFDPSGSTSRRYTENLPAVNLTRSQNMIWPIDPGKPGFIVADPLLTTVEGLQKLSPGSPAVDFGDTGYLSLVDIDMDGQPRDPAPDIGADELSTEPVRLTPLSPGQVGPGSAPAPVLSLPADRTVEATSSAGAVVSFSVTAVDDEGAPAAVALVPPPGSTFPLGTTTVTATATDVAGNTASGSFTVSVRDTTPPAICSLRASPLRLWPPNHHLVPVTLLAQTDDAVDPAPGTRIVSVAGNEAGEPEHGRGHRGPDWVITGDLTLLLRAERSPHGTGRVYTITVESRDSSGNASTSSLNVEVARRGPEREEGSGDEG